MIGLGLGYAAAALAVTVGAWAWQVRTRNAATADVCWAFLVAGGGVALGVASDGDPWRRVLVAALAAAWALRLGLYLLADRVLGAVEEDGRYRALRAHWGERAPRGFLGLYLVQGVAAALFLVPLGAAMRGGPLDAWAGVGVAVWLVAVAGETLADRQLARFRADAGRRGEVCDVGLWRYSRHPNYFFEWVHWWSYVLIGHAAALTFVGPAAMLLFLFRITGIPYTERRAVASRGDRYRAYQRTTSVFVPWPPRRGVA